MTVHRIAPPTMGETVVTLCCGKEAHEIARQDSLTWGAGADCEANRSRPEDAEPPRSALDIARNIINQIGDLWSERIPSDEWVPVRQSTNDELDQFAARLVAGYRPAAPVPIDHDTKKLQALRVTEGDELCPECRGELTSWFCEKCGNTGVVKPEPADDQEPWQMCGARPAQGVVTQAEHWSPCIKTAGHAGDHMTDQDYCAKTGFWPQGESADALPLDPQPWVFVSDQVFGVRSATDKGFHAMSGAYYVFQPGAEYEQDRARYEPAEGAR